MPLDVTPQHFNDVRPQDAVLCRRCRYWQALDKTRERSLNRTPASCESENLSESGFCRRNPPHFNPGLGAIVGEWPRVTGFSWCGEWRAREWHNTEVG
jgi:hypothetical protein